MDLTHFVRPDGEDRATYDGGTRPIVDFSVLWRPFERRLKPLESEKSRSDVPCFFANLTQIGSGALIS